MKISNWYGLWAVLATGDVVVGVTSWLPPSGQAAFAAAGTWFLLLAAPKTVLELQRARRRRAAPDSDADQLAGLTRLPAVLWVGLFLLVDVGALLLGGWWLLGR